MTIEPSSLALPRASIWIATAVVAVAVTGIFLATNRNTDLKESEPDSRTDPTLDRGDAARSAGDTFVSTLPYSGVVPEYAGSDSCRECHQDEHQSWFDSFHRTMTQIMTTRSVKADFDGVVMNHAGEQFALRRKGDEFWVTITDLESAPGEVPKQVRYRLGLVTGSHHMQVFWFPPGAGNLQLGFPFTWLIEDERWVPRESAFVRDPTAPPAREVWNYVCIRCHATAGRSKPNYVRDAFETEVAELGISCEACHGPAERHVSMRRAAEQSGNRTPDKVAEDPIVQPRDLDHVRGSQVCGSCHSMKWFEPDAEWKAGGFKYRPGDDLEETTPVIRPTQLESQPWLESVLGRNPGLLRDFFWSDGMIRVAGREYNGLVESPCFVRGELSCMSCHSMHQSEPNDQLRYGADDNKACLQCHQTIGDRLAAHTRHTPDSDGSRCYNCHMPHTSYALLKAVRSHQIDSPSVVATLETGRPNACNLCHLDKTLAWTSRYLAKWFDQPPPELSEEAKTVSAGIAWLLRGDAGQRALVSWHFGWGPALEASGQGWQPPHLALLLQDPYPAVRYVAAKALVKQIGFERFDYDFLGAESALSAASNEAMARWSARGVAPSSVTNRAALLFDERGILQEHRVRELLGRRDNRPLRLRE